MSDARSGAADDGMQYLHGLEHRVSTAPDQPERRHTRSISKILDIELMDKKQPTRLRGL
jgi:hypothetical protein